VHGFELKASLLSLLKQKDYSEMSLFNEHEERIISYWLNYDPFEYDKIRNIMANKEYDVELFDNDNNKINKKIYTIKSKGSVKILIDNKYYYRTRIKPSKFKLYRVAGLKVINHYKKFIKQLEDFYSKINNENLSWDQHLNNEVNRLLSIDPSVLEQRLRGGIK
jgi:hypothetical protein